MTTDSAANPAFVSTMLANALTVVLPLKPITDDQIASIDGAGHPMTGASVLGGFGGLELGVWQMTEGAMTDVEGDELCVIVAGHGQLHRTIDGAEVVQELRPGTVVELREGEKTLWVAFETLRKVYLA